MASRVHPPDDHNRTTECFKREASVERTTYTPADTADTADTVSIVDWHEVGHRVVWHVCIAVLSGIAAVRIWGASC